MMIFSLLLTTTTLVVFLGVIAIELRDMRKKI
jgi:hypothetical protein